LSNTSDTGSVIENNRFFSNQTGIYASATSAAVKLQVRNNDVYDNSQDGIVVEQIVQASDNKSHGNARYGIWATNTAEVTNNVVYSNNVGILLGSGNNSATATGNRVFNNATIGIWAQSDSDVIGNTAYSNSIGIKGARGSSVLFTGLVSDNLLYANTNQGILIEEGIAGTEIINNTIYQPVGDAVRVQVNSANVRLQNNILWVESGYDVFVATNSQTGFTSNYNLFHQGVDPNAYVGFWGGANRDSLNDWRTASGQPVGQDAQSVAGDP